MEVRHETQHRAAAARRVHRRQFRLHCIDTAHGIHRIHGQYDHHAHLNHELK